MVYNNISLDHDIISRGVMFTKQCALLVFVIDPSASIGQQHVDETH